MVYKDKEKRRATQAAYRARYPERVKASRRTSRCLMKGKTLALKAGLGCQRCGEDDPVCLDFHHRDPEGKEYNLANITGKRCWERVLEEIAKCDVLCANCHRKLHAHR